MSKKNIKFSEDWLSLKNSDGQCISEWCKISETGVALCVLCNQSIKYKVKGKQAIIRHSECEKHKKSSRGTNNQQHMTLNIDSNASETSGSSAFTFYSTAQSSLKAELKWCMREVLRDNPATDCDGTPESFQDMFPDSEIAANFKLSAGKFAYTVTEALGAYFREKFFEDVGNSYYSLMYDETTNAAGFKELQTMVQYWSENGCEIRNNHLQTFFIGHSKSEDIIRCLNNVIDDSPLKRNNILAFGSDGPNVNKKVFRLFNEDMKESYGRTLLNIGTCNLHVVHNAFIKGINLSGISNCISFLENIFSFVAWPSRSEDYTKIQESLGIPKHSFIKHVSSRWLSLEPAVERALEQWQALEEYFLKFVPNNAKGLLSNETYLSISKSLKDAALKPKLMVIVSASKIFIKFLEKFQTEKPLIHLLYEELLNLIFELANRICTCSFMANVKDKESLLLEGLKDDKNMISLHKLFIGIDSSILENLSDTDLSNLRKSYREFYKFSIIHLINKTSVTTGGILKSLSYISPSKIKLPESCNAVLKISKLMPCECPQDVLYDEWRCLQNSLPDSIINNEVELFWKNIFNEKNSAGELKYLFISKFVKCCLALPHGSAAIERGFSTSKRILTDDRSSMSERMLNSRLWIKAGLKIYKNKVKSVRIEPKLIALARSAKLSYENYLKDQKRIEEETRTAKRKREEGEENARLEGTRAKEKRQKVEDLKRQLEEAKRDESIGTSTTDKFLNEATTKLRRGIANRDFTEVSIAQTLLDAANKKREDEKNKVNKVRDLGSKIQKKQSLLISAYFKKN